MIRGGLRARLITDSVSFAIISTLDQLGWFDPTVYDTPPGTRRHRPFRYIRRPVDWAEVIRPNAVAITSEDISDYDLALGGDVEDRHEIYADIFAQDDSVGWHVAYDIRDSLLGKNPELGSLGPQIDVYDFRLATPAPFTTVDIELCTVDRAQGEAREWQRHWFMLRIGVEDEYADETPGLLQPRTWGAADAANWHRIKEAEVHVP